MADITLSYKGATIAEISASGTKTLKTGGKYCEDDISLQYVKPISPWSYLGANPVKVLDIAETETALSATGFNTWTPSTTSAAIVDSSDVGTLELDMENYEYVILWFFDASFVYDGTETNTAKLLRSIQVLRGEIIRRPGSLSKLISNEYNTNSNAVFNTAGYGLLDYYDTSSVNKIYYTYAGLYPTYAQSPLSDITSDTPTITLKSPQIRAQCSTSYFSTSNAGKVDKANSKFKLRGEVWRVDKRGVMGEMYKNIVDMYNGN